jgi:hypothetical protein
MLESEELAGALQRRKEAVDARVATLQADFAAEEVLTARLIEASEQRQEAVRPTGWRRGGGAPPKFRRANREHRLHAAGAGTGPPRNDCT